MSDIAKYDPAFPVELYDSADDMDRVFPGISMRDYFAAAALGGLCANTAWDDMGSAELADAAYCAADAMLAARETAS